MPVLEQLASDRDDVRFVKVEVDREGEVLAHFGTSVLPTYLVFRDGVEIDRMTLTFVPLFLEGRLRGMLDAP